MKINRVLILANNSGGLYSFRKDLMKNLINKGYRVYASTPFDDHVLELTKLGINLIETSVDRRGINLFKDAKLMIQYVKILNRVKPDLIITYTIKPNIYGNLIARLKKISYACNITGLGSTFQKDSLLKRIVTFLYRISLKEAKVVFFENEENRQKFIELKIIKDKQTYKLNGAGVNLEDFAFSAYPNNNEIRFLFIGRIMKEKGIEELLAVAKRIKKEYTNVYFDIVGPMEERYKNIIDKYVEKRIVCYYGYQSNVKPYIQKCHCFVLPSYHEGMANTLLECASMGRPLITSNIHGCLEAISNNGYLVNVKDSNDLYEKLKQFIGLSYEEKIQLGKNSRAYMEEQFDKKKVIEKTMNKLEL